MNAMYSLKLLLVTTSSTQHHKLRDLKNKIKDIYIYIYKFDDVTTSFFYDMLACYDTLKR
jgi:hypothetical protein